MELSEILPKDTGTLNLLWASIFVDELYKIGVRDVCISPGSRSAPLALAFYYHTHYNLYINVDERSSAFFVLGMSKGSRTPCVLVCTSGTAAANYFPAIIEADKSNIPMIVITADRPAKMRNSGANQMIDQINLYGNKVRFFSDIDTINLHGLDGNQIQTILNNLRNLAIETYSFATKRFENGPVHINFQFSKPLEPENLDKINNLIQFVRSETFTNLPTERYIDINIRNNTVLEDKKFESLIVAMKNAKRMIILCGPTEEENELSSKVVDLATHLNLPLFADVLSGIRFSSLNRSKLVLCYNQLISSGIINSVKDPDLILHFGRNPISSAVDDYLINLDSSQKIHITSDINWNKPVRVGDLLIRTDPVFLIESLLLTFPKKVQESSWTSSILNLDNQVLEIIQNKIKHGLEANIISNIFARLNFEINLFLSNSLPIRYIDEFIFNSQNKILVFGNRGVSGIDGIVSTASGIAQITNRATLLIIGDLALFHDIQGLYNIKNLDINFTVLVINNNGGGIFRRLPISKFKEPYEMLFNTPISVEIEKLASFCGLKYLNLKNKKDIQSEINLGFSKGTNQIIEYQTDSIKFEKFRNELLEDLKQEFSIKD